MSIKNKPIILLENVSVNYNGNPILRDIFLKIFPSEIVSIVGPNGSGKTTLLKVIMGFKQPSSGFISVFNQTPQSIQKTGWVGYLPQLTTYNSSFPISVRDVISLPIRSLHNFFHSKISKGKLEQKIDSVLEKVNMQSWKNFHFGSLSGGQKQRVLIARALALEPKLLILDEPSTGLDSVAQNSFYLLLRKLRDEFNMTILMVSHDIGTVSTVVDKIACLKEKIHFHGPPTECAPTAELQRIFGANIQILQHDGNCESCQHDHSH